MGKEKLGVPVEPPDRQDAAGEGSEQLEFSISKKLAPCLLEEQVISQSYQSKVREDSNILAKHTL